MAFKGVGSSRGGWKVSLSLTGGKYRVKVSREPWAVPKAFCGRDCGGKQCGPACPQPVERVVVLSGVEPGGSGSFTRFGDLPRASDVFYLAERSRLPTMLTHKSCAFRGQLAFSAAKSRDDAQR